MCPIWPEQRGGTPPNPAEKAPSECATNLLILLSRRYQEIVGATAGVSEPGLNRGLDL
jgi:hypothetical protein